jgi:predicted enzyme related to lactoylglutathione lyase
MADQAGPEPGTFCWNELLTGDVPGARDFYAKLLGWESQDVDMGASGTYTLFKRAGHDVAGMMKNPQAGAPAHWLSYVAVQDVDRDVDRARGMGAKVFHGPADIPGIGRFAVLQDPTGAVFALFRSLRS